MTPEEFAKQMQEIKDSAEESDDVKTESDHIKQDALMCQVLTELGYNEGVNIFNDTEKWYA